ncbi:hypothetical protein BC834DRAFT_986312 [Gloeopeniophorella convolvens]|nr:hypothetical protein BC834DRAFT_986312 [Gloeopeniophorella convolvens]
MWAMYLSEADRYDKDISESWKDDANGVLVFTGLFSATVATFIIESYKKLSPDSGDQTVVLLQHIYKEISGNASIQIQEVPSSPSTSIVCVNAMWIISLILSITCALAATLMQQWARQYVKTPQLRTAPHERARIRSSLFDGIERFHMSQAVELIPTLLHISVFMFFSGLVVFLFTIFKTVAIIAAVFAGLSALTYVLLTIFPCIYPNCPYRTPLSDLCWRAWHTLVHYAAK